MGSRKAGYCLSYSVHGSIEYFKNNFVKDVGNIQHKKDLGKDGRKGRDNHFTVGRGSQEMGKGDFQRGWINLAFFSVINIKMLALSVFL